MGRNSEGRREGCECDRRSFSRNFGKEAAIFAGLAQACGDVVAVMDCDLQHPPQTLIEMYRLWQEGYEVIEGVKADRGKEAFYIKNVPDFSMISCLRQLR